MAKEARVRKEYARRPLELSSAQIAHLRRLWDERRSVEAIAKELGVGRKRLTATFPLLDPPLPSRAKGADGRRAGFRRTDIQTEARWSDDLLAKFRRGWVGGVSYADLAHDFDIDPTSPPRIAARLGLTPRLDGPESWSAEELKLLRKLWRGDFRVDHIALALGRSTDAVKSRAGREPRLQARVGGFPGRPYIPVVEKRLLAVLAERGRLQGYQVRDLVAMPMNTPLVRVQSILRRLQREGRVIFDGTRGRAGFWRLVDADQADRPATPESQAEVAS